MNGCKQFGVCCRHGLVLKVIYCKFNWLIRKQQVEISQHGHPMNEFSYSLEDGSFILFIE